MGNRLSKVVTKTGDSGMTHFGCDLIEKGHVAIEVLGDIDELNSQIGLTCLCVSDSRALALLQSVQQELFNAGGEIFMRGKAVLITDESVSALEAEVTKLNMWLPPLKEFVLPGGSELSARLHVARSVCRRAERHLWRYLDGSTDKHIAVARYLNRLSDLLFVLARTANQAESQHEVLWRSDKLARSEGQ